MKISTLAFLTTVGALALSGGAARAGTLLLWGNNASNSDVIEAFNPDTGSVVHQYSVGNGNGRGVVIVGNTGYYTQADSGTIGEFNASTGALTGSINTGLSSFASITYNGSDFYVGDYSGSNAVYEINMAGTIVNTLHLSDCGGYCDGLNYYQVGGTGYLISNRGDGETPATYDIYNASTGNLVTASLFTTGSVSGTGVAYDPFNSDFYVSNIYQNTVSVFSDTGSLLNTITLGSPLPNTGTGQRLIEGLSFDYQQTLNVPEPSAALMFMTGLGALILLRRDVH